MKLLAAIIIAAILAVSAPAQSLEPLMVTQIETTEQTAIRRALEELAGRRAEIVALKETIGAKDKQIKALTDLLDNQAQIIALWKEAASARAGANAIDARIEESYKQSVAAYSVELANVRIERDKARSRAKFWGLAGLAFGIVVGVLVGSK